ncbi:MAG: CRISPR-associated helicase Cas3' [Sediminibacterium sp.]|nr:CRISPR-associated helicase Cas3' [Sediminibacterium sp.]
MKNNFFDQFYAKSDGITTLQMHTEHVVSAGISLLSNLSFSNDERAYWGEKLFRCSVLHDLGKIHSNFQKRLNGDRTISIRHEIISLWFCENFLDLTEDELFAIATHHKGIEPHLDGSNRLNSDILTSDMNYHYEKEKDLLQQSVLKEWLTIFNLGVETINKEIHSEISKELRKLFKYSQQKKSKPDWIQRRNFSMMRALLIAADHIGSARMEQSMPSYKEIELIDFTPRKGDVYFSFRKFQENLQTITSDVILHAPTGSGKTEAALSWVFANQRENAHLFYLLPYTASINAMVGRLQNVFGPDRVTALHSKTLDFFYEQLANEESNDERDYEKIEQAAKSKKALSGELFYPVKVTTLHQILKTALRGKGWELALYDYKNALFIVDEFHTYDALLTGLLLASIKLFRRLFNAKFFFMSATIPEFMLKLIIETSFDGDYSKLIRPNPEFESDRIVLDRKRHQLYCENGTSIQDKIPLIESYLAKGYSVLIIVNNVKSAQKIYKDINFSKSVSLLHSGFNKKSRNAIEKLVTNTDLSQRPQLLIATQAVEVSLDIDYDIAFIEKAPIDALIQRFGRINRAGRKHIQPIDRNAEIQYNTVPVYLFENILGKTPFYDNEVLNDSWKYLSALNHQELSENDLIDVCNEVYVNGYNQNQQEDFLQGLNNSTIANFEEDWIAGHWEDWIETVIENSNQKIEVLCLNLVEEFEEKRKAKQYIEANQLLVQVYRYELESLTKHPNSNVIIANNLFYDNIIGYIKKGETFEEHCF